MARTDILDKKLCMDKGHDYRTTENGKHIREVVLKATPSGKSILVDVGINQKRTPAVVDTAAEITVMSEAFAKSLQPDLTFGKDYVLKGAAKGQVFNARLARKVRITLGNCDVLWDVYVAPINDNVLLGLDILRHLRAEVNLNLNTITVNNLVVPSHRARENEKQEAYRVSRVFVSKRTVIPPATIAHVRCRLENNIASDFVVSSSAQNGKPVLVPNTLVRGGPRSTFVLRVINDSPTFRTVKKDSVLGSASEFVEIVSNTDSEDEWMASGSIDFSVFSTTEEVPQVRNASTSTGVLSRRCQTI